jgi:hypothetical protein
MKRWDRGLLVLALTATLFLIVGVGADECSNDNQELFAISSVTNAHAERWDGDGNYSEEICYYNYFSGIYNPGDPTPHDCHGNVVLGISASTNAHVEGPENSTSGYDDVCFGDLSCFLQLPGLDCNDPPLGSNDYSIIVSLDADTNTHPSLTNISSRSLCCKSTSGTDPICNYNGICEEERGETPLNCPDCVTVCGDGKIEGIEECDPGPPLNLSGKNCSTYDPESPFVGGDLGCYEPGHPNQCTFDTSNCLFAQCGDTIDNDGDGANNYPNDFSCSSPGDDDELNPQPECNDGIDNDGDGNNNETDSGCIGPGGYDAQDNREADCGDGTISVSYGEQCDCADPENCLPEELGDQTCEGLGYQGGELGCVMGDGSCLFNVSECVGSEGFCRDNEPFEFQEGEVWLAPSSCQDYNKVYPIPEEEGDPVNHSMRRELCIKNCVPGASDPVNNGYGGLPLTAWGCDFDENDQDGPGGTDVPPYNGECFFWFSMSEDPDERCRLDYEVLEECTSDYPFRKVRVTSTPIPPFAGPCDAGCGAGQSCETEIMCPRVIQLPFIGAFGLALAVIIIALVYAYLKRKK